MLKIPHTIRFPVEMHISLQEVSKEERISINYLVVKAVQKQVELYTKKMEKKEQKRNGN